MVDQRKKAVVAGIIRRLHGGLSVEEARAEILRDVGKLSSAEITDIEQSLIDEGVQPDEIRRFCNVHALLFESALEASVASPESPSHPVKALRRENRRIEAICAAARDALRTGDQAALHSQLELLRGVDRHYSLKENALFPFLERHGFPGPSKVMWSKHDEVRQLLKKAYSAPAGDTAPVESLLTEIEGMVFKEESILFPAALERIPPAEWVQILTACNEIGYAYLSGDGLHDAILAAENAPAQPDATDGGGPQKDGVTLPSGKMSIDELTAVLDTLPVDITFVDAEDRVKYFSQSKDRIFVRATSVIGRNVQNCHPPQSVHKVVEIVKAFKDGTRDHADFWITMNGRFVFIRYFAVRDPAGKYLGTLEVTQDLTEIRGLSGERRLLDD
jgi:hypothetical protein